MKGKRLALQMFGLLLGAAFIATSCSVPSKSTAVPQTPIEDVQPSLSPTLKPTPVPTSTPTPTLAPILPEDITVQEQVLFDKEGVIIKLLSVEEATAYSCNMKVVVENNSEESYEIVVDSALDGIMAYGFFLREDQDDSRIQAGEKVTGNIDIWSPDKMEAQTPISNIGLRLELNSLDETGIGFSDKISIGTSAGNLSIPIVTPHGTVAYDKNKVKVVVLNNDLQYRMWGAYLKIYIENNSDMDISFSFKNLIANNVKDTRISGSYLYCKALAGTQAFLTTTIFESEKKARAFNDGEYDSNDTKEITDPMMLDDLVFTISFEDYEGAPLFEEEEISLVFKQ